eukprot:11199681-Lingulodinium_polyedra.AAC.1
MPSGCPPGRPCPSGNAQTTGAPGFGIRINKSGSSPTPRRMALGPNGHTNIACARQTSARGNL